MRKEGSTPLLAYERCLPQTEGEHVNIRPSVSITTAPGADVPGIVLPQIE